MHKGPSDPLIKRQNFIRESDWLPRLVVESGGGKIISENRKVNWTSWVSISLVFCCRIFYSPTRYSAACPSSQVHSAGTPHFPPHSQFPPTASFFHPASFSVLNTFPVISQHVWSIANIRTARQHIPGIITPSAFNMLHISSPPEGKKKKDELSTTHLSLMNQLPMI